MQILNENEAYACVLCGHLRQMVHNLRRMTSDHWDWTPDIATPSARTLASHTYQWLVCDRQHIIEPDALKHPDVPDLPQDTNEACELLVEEVNRWEAMILGFSPEDFDRPRKQFNGRDMNIRSFVAHMVQNCIFKNGQLATLYFTLGYDGPEPYSAPFPNPIYAQMRASMLNRKLG